MSAKGKILVIRGGAIGDFILTLPAIAALRQRFPDAHLEVLGYPHIVQLAVAGGLVDRVQPIDSRPLAGFFASGGELDEDLRDYFSEFDLIVSYLYDPDGIFRTNISRCSPAQFIIGPHRPEEPGNLHATEVYLQPLQRLAIFEADAVPRLQLAKGARPNQLVLHPGSGSERKNWPEELWAGLLERLATQTELNLLIVGGEAEGAKLQRLAAALPPLRSRVAQSLPLAQLASLLNGSVGFIGHDSGISHLTAALGVPCLVLWGPTAEEIWRPPGNNASVLKDPAGLENLPVETVFRRLCELLAER